MRLSTTRLSHETVTYSLISIPRREDAARALQTWFELKIKNGQVALGTPQSASTQTNAFEGGYFVKLSREAKKEFDTVLAAEELCSITPQAGAVLIQNGSSVGVLALELFRTAMPTRVLCSERLSAADRVMVMNGVMHAYGLLHMGDGISLILHQNPNDGGVMIIPNCAPAQAKIATSTRAEIRIVGLRRSRIVEYDASLLPEVALDLLRAIEQLFKTGIMNNGELVKALPQYLAANERLGEAELVALLKQQVMAHPEFTVSPKILALRGCCTTARSQ